MSNPREQYAAAVAGFSSLVAAVSDEQWQLPGLGEWNIRELVGHSTRALTTVRDYLAVPAESVVLPDVVTYFRQMLQMRGPDIHKQVAQRGREAAAALGDDPSQTFDGLARDILPLIAGATGNELVTTPAGGMRLDSYLETRVFELAVHGLDLARAAGLEWPKVMDEPLSIAGRICLDLAESKGELPNVVLALTNRKALPDAFTAL